MIILTDISAKLQTILNNLDSFSNYEFRVETEGFHIDNIINKESGKNFIPVFVSTMGGQNNPVPNLKQSDYSIPITFYYPVKFKDDFYALNDVLNNIFVGKFITFGTQRARCNLSIATTGEIQNLDMKQFVEWVGSVYRKTIDVMQPWMSMSFTLFLSTAGSEFFYGDDIKIKKIKVTYNGTKILEDTAPICIERADIGSSESAPQQAFGETYIKGYPANLGYTKELPLIVKNTSEYRSLIDYCEKTKDVQKLAFEITEEFPFTTALEVTNKYYATNYSRRTAFGSLIGVSFTLATLRE